MSDIRIVGDLDRLKRISREFPEIGDVHLRREIPRAINRAIKPLRSQARASALSRLPRRGGLAKVIAGSRITTKVRTGRDPAVVLTARSAKGYSLAPLDRGMVRHPVFGNRNRWVNQQVPPGWFTEPMHRNTKNVRRELAKSLDELSRRLVAAGGPRGR